MFCLESGYGLSQFSIPLLLKPLSQISDAGISGSCAGALFKIFVKQNCADLFHP
jgi:hypothetical protein